MRTRVSFRSQSVEEAIEKLKGVAFIFKGLHVIELHIDGYNSELLPTGISAVKTVETPKAEEAPKAEEPKQEETPKAEEAPAPKKEKASKAKKTEKVEEKKALTAEDITAAAKACHKKHGLEVLKAIIASYGAKSISEVKPEDYEAIHAELIG